MPIDSSLTLAFGFGHLAMLGWLAAAAAPLLIHLWNRRQYREVNWAAVEFLLAALRKNARRIQIEQWILLAVRTAIIICVVLALAEPYLESLGINLAAGQRRHKLFVIDGSFSMAAKPADQSRFEEAKQLAKRIVQNSASGDAFSLVLMSAPPRPVVGTPAFDANEFVEELDNLKLPHGPMDLPATLVKIEEILRAIGKEHPRLAQQEVYFFSDLQRAGWLTTDAAGADFRRRSERIAQLAQLHVFDLGQDNVENAAVTGFRLLDSLPVVDRDLTLEVDVANFGRQPRSQQTVELWVDGRRIGEEYVDLGAEDRAAATFTYRFEAAGDHVFEARLPADQVEIDNHRWLATPVKAAIQVLCVNGKPGGGEFGQSTDYLTVALNPQTDRSHALVKPEVVRESALMETDLAGYDAVFFCNVGQFTAAEGRLLEAYLKQGGGIVWFLGDQVLPESYNRFLGGEEPGTTRLLPARIGAAAPEADYRLDPLGYRHPLLTIFRDQEQAGLLSTSVRRFWRLTPDKDSQARVALGLSGGEPIVVEEPLHRGRVILIGTSADISWNMMPVLPSYVPLVQELLTLATSGRTAQRNTLVGQALNGEPPKTTGEQLSIETPAGQAHAVRMASGAAAWQFADTQTSGIYTASLSGGKPVAERFAVNVDTAESNLARLTPEEFRAEIWPGIDFEHHTSWTDARAAAAEVTGQGGRAHLLFLYAALLLLLFEPVLAWHFGHHRA